MKKLLSVFLAAVMTFSLSASVYAGGPDAFPDEEIMVEEAAEDEILVEDTAEEVALAVDDSEAPEAALTENTAETLSEEEVGKIAPVYKYRVYVPETYTETQKYPSVYLMPYDGYSANQYFDDGIEAALDEIMGSDEAIDMIVVMPEYKAGEDYVAKFPELIEEIESNYSVIADPNYRALLGVNVGGYMALETATIESNSHPEIANLFHCFGSLMGDFTSDANPYLADKGSVYNDFVAGMDRMGGRGLNYLSSRFFYIDAPNGSQDSTEVGGTSDIGAGLEKRSNPYWNTVDYDVFSMRVLGEEGGKLVFKTGGEDLDYMPANKAYLSVPLSAAAVLTTDGSTAIQGVKTETTAEQTKGIFTLNGVRLPDNATLQKGVYIKDGKKIVIP